MKEGGGVCVNVVCLHARESAKVCIPSWEDQGLAQNNRNCFWWCALVEEGAADFRERHPTSAIAVARENVPGLERVRRSE